ncbi:leucine-rich repeat domain-containing protein [Pseudanabaena sp. UWO311]|nr:leucine-rich repeat domain-containing protein [Pseudanabaena sp. UWO311]
MKNLTTLNLNHNKIDDIKPLAGLTQLRGLSLHNNQIANIQPLASLKKLEQLIVSQNKIKSRVCPVSPQRICEFEGDEGARRIF